MTRTEAIIGSWTPPSWVLNCFPRPTAETEVVSLEYIIAALDRHTSTITDADSTPLGAAMHVAHMLVTLQGADGLWPAQLNLRTGRAGNEMRSSAPVPLMRRLNALLYSTEFDPAISRADAAAAASSHDSEDQTGPNT
jgi:hypothetical protein